MKCPFRVDENGDFKECYGADCMAYFEYDTRPFSGHMEEGNSIIIPLETTAHACKQMMIYAKAPNYCV